MTKPRRHRSRHLFTLLGTLVLGFLVLPVTTASARDGTDPTTPTNLRVTDRGATSLSISWSASRDRVGVAGYAIYANSGSTKLGKVTAAQLTGLTCGTSYTIRVDAFDAAGNRSGKAIVTQSTLACAGPTKLYVATNGSDSSSCTYFTPCLTFNRAYQVAQAGTVIEVSAGNYPAQQLLRHSAKTSSVDVVFQPAAGATVRVDRIHLGAWPGWSTTGPLGASHITFRDFKTNMVTAYGAQDFTWQNIDAKTFYMNAVDGGTVKGGDYGPCLSTEDPLTGCFGAQIGGGGNTNVVIDGARFHDFRNGNPSGGIVCLEVVSGTRVTVKNSQFQDCEHANILIEDWGSAPIAEVTIQANSLDMAWDGAGTQDDLSAVAVDVSGSASNVAVRNNLLCPPGTIDAPASDVTTSGNVASTSACSSGYTPPAGSPAPSGSPPPSESPPPDTTPAPDTSAPSTPAGLAASSPGQTSVVLRWGVSTDNLAVTGYGLYRNGASVGTVTQTSATFSGLTCGTSYTLGVDAYDAAGNRSSKGALGVSTSACPVPPSGGGDGGGGGDLLVSMTGDDANPCTQAAPCRSFNRAYQAAQPGQVVVVAAGSYPQQNLYRHAAKTSLSDVVFQPAGGASVTVDSLHIGSYPHWQASALANPGASHVTLRGFRVTKLVSVANADDVTIENVTARSVYANGAHDLLVKSGSYGPCTAPSDFSACTTSGLDNGWAGSARKNERITFDGVTFHDYRLAQPGSGEHWECMIVFQAHDLTVRNSRFTNCEQFNVLLDSFDPQNHHVTGTVRFENNFFDLPMHDVPGGWEPWHYSLFLDAPGGATYIVRNNRFCSDGRLVIGTYVPAANVTETGSVSDPAAC